ncbi:MAG: ribonuclease HI family protein [Candidatus Doudnabacteria bacterium]|nr:ribonuclease HI family protein [Candidatus Doudnabacteria bacterium]
MSIKDNKLIIFTDGGARGNPGPAAYGVVIYDSKRKLLKKLGKYLGERTNNEAEYEGVIAGLEAARKMGAKEIEFYLDSQLVVRQLKGIYKVKEPRLQALLLKVRNLETHFKTVKCHHIPREKNKLADKLVNQSIEK